MGFRRPATDTGPGDPVFDMTELAGDTELDITELAGDIDPHDAAVTEPADRRDERPHALRVLQWWERSDYPVYLLSVALTIFATVRALNLWLADLRVPFVYSNDATAILAHFKTVLETGWYEYQPSLGAPLGQNYHDFPQADNLHMMVADILGLLSHDVAVVVNTYYLIGFPLAAITAVWFFRRVGVSKTMAVVLSVLFVIAPFHWEKGENHLFLAAYYPVPLALGVVLMAVRGEALWGLRARTVGMEQARLLRGRPYGAIRRRLDGLRSVVTGRGMGTFAILALIGTASTYYGVFVLILLAAAGLIALIRTVNWRRFAGTVVAGASLAAVMFANMAPDILYSIVHGNNSGSLVRDDSESERYALKLAQLILPSPDHQFAPFRKLRLLYDTTYPFVSERPALGMVAAAGFLGLLGFVLVRLGSLAGASRRHEPELAVEQFRRRTMLGYLALLTIVAFLFSTVGGFETIVSFYTSSLRSWNRMSILIALFSLAAFGLATTATVGWIGRRRHFREATTRVLAVLIAIVVLIVGIWDQSTLRAIPAYSTVAALYNADQDWIDSLEAALPDNAMVFQMAYQPFPEAASVNGVIYTDALKPFLHSTTLRWSAGSMRGRSVDDWNALVAAEPVPQMIADLVAVGFEGIMIDRRTYADAGSSMESMLTKALGTGPSMTSANARYTYFGLGPERARLAAVPTTPAQIAFLADAVLKPVFLYYNDDDFTVGTNSSREALWTSRGPSGRLILDNARGASVAIKLSMVLTSPTNATQVMLTTGGQSWVVALSGTAASAITLEFDAAPGRNDFLISPGPDAFNVNADTQFGVANVAVVDVNRPNLGAITVCPGAPASNNC